MSASVDTVTTETRQAVQQLYKQLGLVPVADAAQFACGNLSQCREHSQRLGRPFHAGTWPYVGPEYGHAMVGGIPTRILFVAMERGGAHDPAEELAFAQTQQAFREATENPGNPHMGGVSLVMDRLVDERDPQRRSLQFALTNAVKCVEFTKNMNSTSTGTMITNCSGHLRAEIDLLRPDLIVTQGNHPRDTVLNFFTELRAIAQFSDGQRRCDVFTRNGLVVVTTPHPARQKGLEWKHGLLPDFFEEALRVAHGQIVGAQRGHQTG